MNVELASQIQSPLLQSLQASLVSKPFNYSLQQNFPLLSKETFSVSPQTISGTTTSGLNTTLQFQVPRYGLLYGMCLKCNIGVSAGAGTLTRLSTLGSRLFSNVSLRSNSKIIQDNSASYILSRMLESPQEMYNAYENMTTGVPTVAASVATSVVYTPLFFFFGEKTGSYFDTGFAEPLEVIATVNSLQGIWGDVASTPTIGFNSITLECYYIQMESSVLNSLRASQFPVGSSLNMLVNDCYNESPAASTYASGSTLSMSLECKVKNVASATYVYARNKTTNLFMPINSLVMTANGQTIVNSDRRTQIFENTKLGQHIFNVPGSSTGSSAYFLYYGLDVDKTYMSGAQAFQSLNNPTITAIVDTSAGATAADVIELYAVHDIASLIAVDSSSGSVVKSLTN
jgi:hypothetical protein